MTTPTDNSPAALEALRLPQLQARFAEVVGEPTRCPNRTFLMRRITEALESSLQEAEFNEVNMPTDADDVQSDEVQVEELGEAAATRPEGNAATIAEWQARYLEVVGRPTGSSNVRYMRWKIRQAERGLVPVGPTTRQQAGAAAEHKVVPLRLAVETLEGLDEARKRQGLKSRMELFRRALHLYLTSVGETEAAEPFAQR